jgi:hypothetical protein
VKWVDILDITTDEGLRDIVDSHQHLIMMAWKYADEKQEIIEQERNAVDGK